jgi:dihydrodipicolinate reductase
MSERGDQRIRVRVIGAGGRMGRPIGALLAESATLRLAAEC